MQEQPRVKTVLSIAGSDSGGGAGIQADLKAFAAAGVHGMTAITAITAQNTVGVTAIEHISPAMIKAQVTAVLEDIGVDAVKIGMLGRSQTIKAVVEALAAIPSGVPIVLDPVMVSESGATLLDSDAKTALITELIPLVTVVTPNLHEAEGLAGLELPAQELLQPIKALGPKYVLITGGHREKAVDLLFDGERVLELAGERFPGGNSHGSGCTHSSTLAANLALGLTVQQAAARAKEVAAAAVRDGLAEVGRGPGPVDVFGLSTAR